MSQRKGKSKTDAGAFEMIVNDEEPLLKHDHQSTSSNDSRETTDHSAGLKGDRASVALLIFLYVLQGIPLGLAGSIPYLLQSRKV